MPPDLWRRFTGAAAAREGLAWNLSLRGVRTAAVIEPGKNAEIVRAVLAELGIAEVQEEQAEALVIGTLSPGPMMDAFERRRSDARVVAPCRLGEAPSTLIRAA